MCYRGSTDGGKPFCIIKVPLGYYRSKEHFVVIVVDSEDMSLHNYDFDKSY